MSYYIVCEYFCFRYVAPTKWLPRDEHASDSCYFCMNNKRAAGYTYATRNQIDYAKVDSVVPPVLRSDENPLALGERDSGEEEMDFDMAAGQSAGPSVAPTTVGTSSTNHRLIKRWKNRKWFYLHDGTWMI